MRKNLHRLMMAAGTLLLVHTSAWADGTAKTATFEDLSLEAESHWNGPDPNGVEEEGLWGDTQKQGGFVSGGFRFANNYSLDWGSWSGFSDSNCTATTGTSYTTDQWNSCVGKGANGSSNYAVFYEDAYAPMTVTVVDGEGETISGFYITNAAMTVNAYENGDGMTDGAFTTGDFFLLTITGDNDEQVEFYLADYRSENAAEHYYVKDWQWVDLSSLGSVKELTFSLKSSRKNAYGYTTPLYFCMDDFNGESLEGVATMEDLALESESFWNGSDGTGSFESGNYRFENGFETSSYGDYAYGFFYSNKTDTSFANYVTDMYNSCVGEGAKGSKNYAVFNLNNYTPKGVEILSSEEGETVSGFYVTNAAYAYQSMLNGDDYAKKFGEGDWFLLTITGIDAAGKETGSVDFYLADLRDAAASYIINTWRWVDLTSLGKVKRLAFSMNSSDTGQWGMNTPAYFCMDNLGGTKPEYEEPIATFIAETQIAGTEAAPVAIYSLSGIRLNELQPGMNIVKYADGSTRTIFKK